MTIVEFLKQRLDEDEAAAEQAASGSHDGVLDRDDYGRLLIRPDRMLAEVAAKRRIVDAYRSAVVDEQLWRRKPDSHAYHQAVARVSAWTYALQQLASIYPDYDPNIHT